MSSYDPTITDPELYTVLFENDRVRVLEYQDWPGDKTHPHAHPDSVMYTLSSFQRHLTTGDREADVDLPAGRALWLGAQDHVGHNTGNTKTHAIFIELKEPNPSGASVLGSPLGPDTN